MKTSTKASLYLLVITLLHLGFRKGALGFLIPFQLPLNGQILVLFALFVIAALALTKWFSKSDSQSLGSLGISLSKLNRKDFLIGFLVGFVFWGGVSMAQSISAGFSWTLRPDGSIVNVIYGLVFIFIADLGTELSYRGYPLKTLKDSLGAVFAILTMSLVTGVLSYSSEVSGELLFYSIAIPSFHSLFFGIIYLKTGRLGGALGIHTAANFVTISIFDLRPSNSKQAIPSGIFESSESLEHLSLTALQLPWLGAAILFSIVVVLWWKKT